MQLVWLLEHRTTAVPAKDLRERLLMGLVHWLYDCNLEKVDFAWHAWASPLQLSSTVRLLCFVSL
jgi:hypothetical protein